MPLTAPAEPKLLKARIARQGWFYGLLGLSAALLAIGIVISPIEWAWVLACAPIILVLLSRFFCAPRFGLFFTLTYSFFVGGIARYVELPWGLVVDIILLTTLVGLLFQPGGRSWRNVHKDIVYLSGAWGLYLVLLLFNPDAPGPVAWSYAVRGIGIYTLIVFIIGFKHLRRGDVVVLINVVFVCSILASLWGLRQQFFGLDSAENYWLFDLEHDDEHLLHGVLRVFSFFSDAGQFGASQAMVALMAGVLILGPFSWRQKFFYAITAIFAMLGFLYSGTRGALAVPAAGVLVYLVLSKNFKILIAGLLAIGVVFYLLKFTYVAHSFQPVARIRTALSADNPSLQARLRNQVTFGRYLESRPLGGGVGSAGYWGERFRPGSLLAETPTDSYYVKIWAETGIIGICFQVFLLGYFLGKGGVIVWHTRDPRLRYQAMSILAAYGGVLLANYGNQVYSQFPTGIIMPIGLTLIFLVPRFEAEALTEPQNQEIS